MNYRVSFTDITNSRCRYFSPHYTLDAAIQEALDYAQFIIDISEQYNFVIVVSEYLPDIDDYVVVSKHQYRGVNVR